MELVPNEAWHGPNNALTEGDRGPVTPFREAKKRQRAAAARGVITAPQRGDGWRLTDADTDLMKASTRYGAVSWRQAQQAFYNGAKSTTTNRVGNLVDTGLMVKRRDDEWAGRVLLTTSAGHRLIRDDLPVPLSVGRHPGERLLHRLAVTDLGLRFEERGEQVITERELRAAEGTKSLRDALAARIGIPDKTARDGKGIDRRFCVPIGASGAVHYPDLIVVTDAGLVAVEVEVTPKATSRLREILRGYRDAKIFTEVVYFATPKVEAQMHGVRDDRTDEWVPGVLQQLSLLPSGRPDYTNALVQVKRIAPRDPGVAYRLDMNEIPDGLYVTRAQWTALRAAWAADTATGKAARIPFLRWWRDIEIPRTERGRL